MISILPGFCQIKHSSNESKNRQRKILDKGKEVHLIHTHTHTHTINYTDLLTHILFKTQIK